MSSIALPHYQTRLRPADVPAATVRALYVHVPFCFHKCHYCDFYSITRQPVERMEAFVDRVLGEARQWVGARAGLEVRPETVFFGGGTPSLLPTGAMKRLIEGLRGTFDFSGLREWTVECNPATVTPEYLAMLRGAGVDRVSFGAQSFDRGELAMLERHHDPADVPAGVEMARGAGFSRINVDLIYAIPGQTLESWAASLERAVEIGTKHLSCYGLTYEPNTPMAVKKRLGMVTAAEDSVELRMLHSVRERLGREGLRAYEISNYAVPGEECRHNLTYWHGEDYVGLGPSAASHVQGWRWKNRPHLGEWEVAVDGGGVPTAEVEVLSARRRAGELAFLMLRLGEGIEFGSFERKTGLDARALFADPIERYAGAGLLVADNRRVKMTERGIDVADALAGEFVAAAGG